MGNESMHADHDGGMRTYAWVWVWLLALTVVEVILAGIHVFPAMTMLVVLMVLSLGKTALIMAYFMHLRFERASLVLSLVPFTVIVIALLFIFFPDSFRLFELRG